ncbi:MAG: HlyD family secretion protein [Acidobacteriota bacterium]|jgi:multidrug resistance efflux pump
MELLITIAYIFLVRLIFFDYKLIKFNLFWKFIVFGLWVAAAMTEIILLGQWAPYTKSLFVQSYVVQMAPDYGGFVSEVYVSPNQMVKKGDPLFQMDPAPWQYQVDELEAQLAAADTDIAELNQQVVEAQAVVDRLEASLQISRLRRDQIAAAASQQAVSQIRLEDAQREVVVLETEIEGAKAAVRSAQIALDSQVEGQPTDVAEVLAQLATAKYNLEHATILAPADGYVVNLQLHPGTFIRLKQEVMTFVSTEEYWLGGTIRQRGTQYVRPGDKAEVAFEMYPGMVFPAEVVSVVWAAGESQGIPSGQIPHVGQLRGAEQFMVRIEMTGDHSEYPLRFGASGLAALYTSEAPDFIVFLRQIEIQSESFLNYLYNPFE